MEPQQEETEEKKKEKPLNVPFSLVESGPSSVLLLKNTLPCLILTLDKVALSLKKDSKLHSRNFLKDITWMKSKPDSKVEEACLEECWQYLDSLKQPKTNQPSGKQQQ